MNLQDLVLTSEQNSFMYQDSGSNRPHLTGLYVSFTDVIRFQYEMCSVCRKTRKQPSREITHRPK